MTADQASSWRKGLCNVSQITFVKEIFLCCLLQHSHKRRHVQGKDMLWNWHRRGQVLACVNVAPVGFSSWLAKHLFFFFSKTFQTASPHCRFQNTIWNLLIKVKYTIVIKVHLLQWSENLFCTFKTTTKTKTSRKSLDCFWQLKYFRASYLFFSR